VDNFLGAKSYPQSYPQILVSYPQKWQSYPQSYPQAVLGLFLSCTKDFLKKLNFFKENLLTPIFNQNLS